MRSSGRERGGTGGKAERTNGEGPLLLLMSCRSLARRLLPLELLSFSLSSRSRRGENVGESEPANRFTWSRRALPKVKGLGCSAFLLGVRCSRSLQLLTEDYPVYRPGSRQLSWLKITPSIECSSTRSKRNVMASFAPLCSSAFAHTAQLILCYIPQHSLTASPP